MNIAGYTISKLQILIILILLLGIIVTVFLVQRQQVIKSKATTTTTNLYYGLEVTDPNGAPLEYRDNYSRQGTRSYYTDSLQIKIKLGDINALVGE